MRPALLSEPVRPRGASAQVGFARAAAARPVGRGLSALVLARPAALLAVSFAARSAQPAVWFAASVPQAARPVCPAQRAAVLAQPAASPDGRDAQADLALSAFVMAFAPKELAARSARPAAVAHYALPREASPAFAQSAAVEGLIVLPRAAEAAWVASRPEVEQAVWPQTAAVQVLQLKAVRALPPEASARALRQVVHLPAFSSPRGPAPGQASLRTARIAALARSKVTRFRTKLCLPSASDVTSSL